jgi:hypothetical protein
MCILWSRDRILLLGETKILVPVGFLVMKRQVRGIEEGREGRMWDGESVAEVLVDVAVFYGEFGCGIDRGDDVRDYACLLEYRAD